MCGTEAIRDKLAESIDLDVDLMVWGDYGESFAWADVAIGHGGTSFVFHCLNSSTIPLFFPTMADQFMLSKAVSKVLGVPVFYNKYGFFSKLRCLFSGCVYLNSQNFKNQIQRIESNFSSLSSRIKEIS